MSDIADTPVPAPPVLSTPPVHTVHEAYSFACMKCGYSWEQGYEIEHHVDGTGQPFIMYTVSGERVPSPLSNPTCMNCGGHVVRIMREGQVSAVRGTLDSIYHHPVAPGIAGPVPAGVDVPRTPKPRKARRPRHDAPGPVAIDPEGRDERRGLLARLRAMFRS
ncbi:MULTISPECIES: hypothetical protein [unclassified Streptomyces]|uniref:hypothetical protein n=1 Tax=unclassified Streptomyces TaxID=2593676 RepID=UPI002254DE30|nr:MULTISPECIES: hypothetical protein [unclassified Streptomyces]MCX4526256.1 hypothetical protein [Streptomyces sp. NBC_01551]MCX4543180.1 hypothetical protein [Streptomyces sp. NBC_01565]